MNVTSAGHNPYMRPDAPKKGDVVAEKQAQLTDPAAKQLAHAQGKLDDDTRQKRCDDIIENDKRAVKLAAAESGTVADTSNKVDTYA